MLTIQIPFSLSLSLSLFSHSHTHIHTHTHTQSMCPYRSSLLASLLDGVQYPRTTDEYTFFLVGQHCCLHVQESIERLLLLQQCPVLFILLGWLVVLFYGISTFFGSFNAKSSHFDKKTVLVWFGFMAHQLF